MLVLEKREYQDQCVDLSIDFLMQKKPRNGIVIIPPGGGKSLIAARIILGLDGPAVLFQPRKELLLQNLAKLRLYGYEPSVFSASVTSRAANPRKLMRREVSEITLATIKTAISSPDLFQDTRYVLIDEASEVDPAGGQYKEFQEALPKDVRYLGLDATPFRMYSNARGTELRFLTRQKPRFFSEVVYYAQIKDLLSAGYLHKPDYFSLQKQVGFDEDRLTINSTGSEYTEDSVQMHLFEIGFNDKLADVVRRLIAKKRRGILIFVQFTREADYLAQAVPGVAVVTAKTDDDERDRILTEFKAGVIKAVANVGIAGIGFDYPELDTLVLGRITRSLRLYYQWIGRVIRTHPDKKDVWVIDMVGLVKRFGKIEDLVLYCAGESEWAFWGRPGGGAEKQLTNKYFDDVLAGCCLKCHAPRFFAMYEKSGKMVPVSAAPPGMRPKLVVEQDGKKKKCHLAGPDETPTHLFHFIACDRFRKLRKQAA